MPPLAAAVALVLWAALVTVPAWAQEPGLGGADRPFVLRAQGRCLEAHEQQLPLNGARVQLQRCEGAPHQLWRHDRGWLVNQASNRCLEVHGPDAGFNGARVQVVNCSSSPHQQWRYEGGQLVARVDGRCLEAQSSPKDRSLATAHTWDCDASLQQRFEIRSLRAADAPAAWPPQPLQPPRSRQVEAGPLFSTAEATQRCPAVCAPGRWSGQWVTTVPGRMSVCACLAAPVGPAGWQQPEMSDARFEQLLRLLDDEVVPSRALRSLETVARDQHFTVDQVRRLLDLFPFPSDRLRALDITLPRVLDRGDAFQLLSAFSFESDRAEARNLLERAGSGR